MNLSKLKYIFRIFIFILILFFTLPVVCTLSYAAETDRIIRVGYFDYEGYFETDQNGRLFGYGIDYLNEVSKHTGWQYEYVYSSWNEILTMLEYGEIDLISVARYCPERAEKFVYCKYPSGNEQNLMYVSLNNKSVYYNDYQAFDGMKIGVLKGSLQNNVLLKYASKYRFSYTPVLYDEESEAIELLEGGSIDAMISVSESNQRTLKLVGRLSTEPFYCITYNGNEAFMAELENALSQIRAENPRFEEMLFNSHFASGAASAVPTFTREEAEYIQSAGPITIAVTKRLPWAFSDETGAATGITKDMLNEISRISGLKFDVVQLPTSEMAMQAASEGKTKLAVEVFDSVALKDSDAEISDIYFSEFAVPVGRKGFSSSLYDPLTVAVPVAFKACINYLEEHYPQYTIIKYDDAAASIRAVFDGEADIMMGDVLVVNYLLQRPVYEGLEVIPNFTVPEDFCITSRNGENSILMSVINKTIAVLNRDVLNSIVISYTAGRPYTLTFSDIIYKYRISIVWISLSLAALAMLITYNLKLNKRHLMELQLKNIELERAVNETTYANKAKSDFLSRMSHEIRTPLNAITGSITIAAGTPDLPSKSREYLGKAMTASSLLLSIINDVLDMSAIEQNKLKLASEPFDIMVILRALNSIYDAQCGQKGIIYTTYRIDIEHNILIGDALRVNQILINLLSNAVKFTPSGGTITARTEQHVLSSDRLSMTFTISDTGEGMSDEMLENLFKPFEQEDGTTARRHGGSGLGLSIAHNLTEMMNGTIKVESRKKEGTTFSVMLPFTYDDIAEIAGDPSHTDDGKYDFTGKKILLAEDNEINGEIVKELLSDTGITIDWVRNGREAASAFESSADGEYGLILMDIQMPVIDGYEATRLIRAFPRHNAKEIPIIALTADAFREDADRALKAGMNGHLSKPIELKLLLNVLQSYL